MSLLGSALKFLEAPSALSVATCVLALDDALVKEKARLKEGDLPVTVAVLPVPVEGFEMTLADLQSHIDGDVVAHGAALCVGRALASDGPMPVRLRFDVVSVCVNLDAGRVRVHHVRGAWQS
ncbi:MAG: hypothetical protein IJ092_12140 [Atopobiaceae bacterium]|nr:hypothetical protein [Atopobiaceae bacterium]